MTPEQLNRLAMWGTIGILVVAGSIFGIRQVASEGTTSAEGPIAVQSGWFNPPSTRPVTAEAPSVAGPAAPGVDTTISGPAEAIVSAVESMIDLGIVPATSTTSPTTSTAAPATTTTPTTTTLPATTTTVTAATTTTTTTVPVTATTVPVTTTTIPATTTTSTTVPITTTTAATTAGLFVERFDGQAQGDSDAWNVLLSVDLGATVSGTWRAQVYVSWGGDNTGTAVLETGGSGKVSAVVGPFGAGSVVFTITDVRSAGWVYLPGLNQAATRLTVLAPTG